MLSLRALADRRLAVPSGAVRARRDPAVEGLRGAAALSVLYAHLTAQAAAVDPAFVPPARLALFNIAHAAVLVFFVLSGYVIGLSTSGPADKRSIPDYLRRRARRIVPLTLIAVVLGYVVGPGGETRAFLANLLFLQNDAGYGSVSAPLLAANANLWSLHYEVVCYAAFIVLWLLRPRLGPVLALIAVIGLLGHHASSGLPLFLGGWAMGLLFWTAGLALAWHRPQDPPIADTASNWPAALLALLAVTHLDPLASPFARLGLSASRDVAVTAADLAFLPGCLWLLAAAAGRAPGLCRRLGLATCALLLASFAWRLARPGAPVTEAVRLGGFAALAAAALVGLRAPRATLARIAPLGAISFALYALAAPIQHWVLHLPLPAGSALTWAGRAALVTALALGAAWLLESVLPGWLKKRAAARIGTPTLAAKQHP